ncbi:hypothetical protein GALL_540120 [mine drainage metagenome]|uniref:Uncharacterized protein n=1 Tax=mine drainage metagenome TaxID=410659 RepID=A0A1J5PLM7_9ZZZZ
MNCWRCWSAPSPCSRSRLTQPHRRPTPGAPTSSPPVRACCRCCPKPGWWRAARPACSSAASRAPARRCWRRRFTAPARVVPGRSSPSIAPPFPKPCWSPNCLATPRARSPGPARRRPGCSSRPAAAPSSSTRSATCRCRCKSSCCAFCRSGRCVRWARRKPSMWTCASSRRRTAISTRPSWKASSVTICTIASTWSACTCRRCASGARTSPCWRSIFCKCSRPGCTAASPASPRMRSTCCSSRTGRAMCASS